MDRRLETTVIVVLFALALGGCKHAHEMISVPTDHPTIQTAIDAAHNSDVVVVAKGTYRENIDFRGKAITLKSNYESDPSARAGTIINGDKKGSVVTFKSRERADSALLGFTITNGSSSSGGGVYCTNSSPTLKDNIISGNRAIDGGGVDCVEESSPTLTNNTISGNSASWGGGGVSCRDSSPELTGNTISGNRADISGGGVSCTNCSPTLTRNAVTGNWASGEYGSGGGVSCNASSPTLSGNTISGNYAALYGGGVCCSIGSCPVLTNDIITGNIATTGGGGGLYVSEFPNRPSKPIVTYCDLHGNTGGDYGNYADQTGEDGNISQDPLFADAAHADFHLRSKGGRWDPKAKAWVVDAVHSPCVDAGDPRSTFDSEPPPNGGRVNMGAYGNSSEASKSAPAA